MVISTFFPDNAGPRSVWSTEDERHAIGAANCRVVRTPAEEQETGHSGTRLVLMDRPDCFSACSDGRGGGIDSGAGLQRVVRWAA